LLIYTLLLLAVKFGVWCAMNAMGQLFESHKFIPLCYTYSDPNFLSRHQLQENLHLSFSKTVKETNDTHKINKEP